MASSPEPTEVPAAPGMRRTRSAGRRPVEISAPPRDLGIAVVSGPGPADAADDPAAPGHRFEGHEPSSALSEPPTEYGPSSALTALSGDSRLGADGSMYSSGLSSAPTSAAREAYSVGDGRGQRHADGVTPEEGAFIPQLDAVREQARADNDLGDGGVSGGSWTATTAPVLGGLRNPFAQARAGHASSAASFAHNADGRAAAVSGLARASQDSASGQDDFPERSSSRMSLHSLLGPAQVADAPSEAFEGDQQYGSFVGTSGPARSAVHDTPTADPSVWAGFSLSGHARVAGAPHAQAGIKQQLPADDVYLAVLAQHRALHPDLEPPDSAPRTGSDSVLTDGQSRSFDILARASRSPPRDADVVMRPPRTGTAPEQPALADPMRTAAGSGIFGHQQAQDGNDSPQDRSSPKRRKLDLESIGPGAGSLTTGTSAVDPKSRKSKAKPPAKQRATGARGEAAALLKLQNARYNERGEMIEDEPERSLTPEDVTMADAEIAAEPIALAPSGPSQTTGSSDWMSGLSRRERQLLSAKYNEKGEIIEEPHGGSAPSAEEDVAEPMRQAPLAIPPDIFAPSSTSKNKGKSKSKAKTSEARSSAVFATPDPPTVKKAEKKSKIIDDDRSDRSASVFTLHERRAETTAAQAKKSSKTAVNRIVEIPQSRQSDTPEPPPEQDDRLYCICQKPYNAETDDDDMIECDRCDNWFHLSCVNIIPAELDLIDTYICPNCEKETAERTTRKTKCRREGCSFARFEPMSKYCSDECGMLHMMASLRARNIQPLALHHTVATAHPVEGIAFFTSHGDDELLKRDQKEASAWRKGQKEALQVATRERLHKLELRLADLEQQKLVLQTAISAANALPAVPRAADSETSKTKKSKAKTTTAATLTDRPCGYNPALMQSFSVDRPEDLSVDGQETPCMISERKCRRHNRWIETSGSDLDLLAATIAEQKAAVLGSFLLDV